MTTPATPIPAGADERRPDKAVLLDVGDGPDGIQLYTSEDEAIATWAAGVPALFLIAQGMGAYVKLGPFLPRVLEQLRNALAAPSPKAVAEQASAPDIAGMVEEIDSLKRKLANQLEHRDIADKALAEVAKAIGYTGPWVRDIAPALLAQLAARESAGAAERERLRKALEV
jgi:hypothetical protein